MPVVSDYEILLRTPRYVNRRMMHNGIAGRLGLPYSSGGSTGKDSYFDLEVSARPRDDDWSMVVRFYNINATYYISTHLIPRRKSGGGTYLETDRIMVFPPENRFSQNGTLIIAPLLESDSDHLIVRSCVLHFHQRT